MKKCFFLLILILILPVLSGCGESDRTHAEGIALFEEGKYKEAMEKYRLSLSQGEEGGEIYADMAIASVKLADYSDAAAFIETALSFENTQMLQMKAGYYYGLLGEYEKAEECYQESMKTASGKRKKKAYFEAEALLSELYMEQGKYEEAVTGFNELLSEGYYPLEHGILAGACYVKMRQFKAASAYFDQAAEDRKCLPEHYIYIVGVLEEEESFDLADAYFEKGLSVCGKKENMSVFEYCMLSGRTEEALLQIPDDLAPEEGILLGEYLTEKGDYEAAEAVYQRLLTANEMRAEIYVSYMKLKILEGETDIALQLYSECALSGSDEVLSEGIWNEVILYENQGDYEKAYALLADHSASHVMSERETREYVFLSRTSGN